MQNNPFPTLTQISSTRWEGDGRIIQVVATGIGYLVTIGTTEYSLGNSEQVQRLIANVPPITGTFEPEPQGKYQWYTTSTCNLSERSITVPRSKRNAY